MAASKQSGIAVTDALQEQSLQSAPLNNAIGV
jgi:hypothetical protein